MDRQQFGFWNFGRTLLNLLSQPPWWPLGSLNTFSPVVPPSGRLPLLSIAWEVCHRSNPSSGLLHSLGESSLERKQLIFTNALRGKCPSLTQFLYWPFVIGIVLDLVHQVPSHYYNVCPKLSAHHPKWYQVQNFIPVLQDNLVKIWQHRARVCDPYLQHVGTRLNPISNFGKSLHL